MLFNSNEFLGFFACFFAAYILLSGNPRLRTWLVIVASYTFYSQWDYRFTGLLLFTSLADFTIARIIDGAESQRTRRGLLILSIALNLGILGFFKYYNFFQESFYGLLNSLGIAAHWRAWEIVLPVGISFYTFQSMGYVIDVYRREISACRALDRFLAYVSFFPQLVAGPIERASNLVPQFEKPLRVTAADIELGIWLIIWGMFKKVALADNLAPLVELAYQHGAPSLPIVALGTIAFGLQIYCDFSGYCDIASGLAGLLGFKLMLNFNLPYFAASPRAFWRRWHISLSTWLRDYLYIPLGGGRQGEARTYLNLGIVMLLGGLWHGAAPLFLLWGIWHGLGLMANRAWERHRPLGVKLPGWFAWLLTQIFVFVGWMFFRAGSVDNLLRLSRCLTSAAVPPWWGRFSLNLLVLAVPLLAMELWQWRSRNLQVPLTVSRGMRACLQAMLLIAIAAYWQREGPSPFIYFQF